MLLNFVMVGIGGGIGASFRAFLSDVIKKRWNLNYPLATFLINVTGAFLLGVIIHYYSDGMWKLLFGTGLMGGYTTFSTFHYEAVSLIRSGRKRAFLLYYILSVVCGIIAAFLGIIL
jgi:CrcB protein